MEASSTGRALAGGISTHMTVAPHRWLNGCTFSSAADDVQFSHDCFSRRYLERLSTLVAGGPRLQIPARRRTPS